MVQPSNTLATPVGSGNRPSSSQNDARILLPRRRSHPVELWLALTLLETHGRAKGMLNKARKAIDDSTLIDATFEVGVRELKKHNVLLARGQ